MSLNAAAIVAASALPSADTVRFQSLTRGERAIVLEWTPARTPAVRR